MQGMQTYAPTANPQVNRNSMMMIVILVLFLLLGAGVGYFAAASAVKQATLNVQVENDTGAAQDIRILVNGDQVAVITVPVGQTATYAVHVGWTSTTNGMYEVRATPLNGVSDSERVTVTNGQTFVVTLRVR